MSHHTLNLCREKKERTNIDNLLLFRLFPCRLILIYLKDWFILLLFNNSIRLIYYAYRYFFLESSFIQRYVMIFPCESKLFNIVEKMVTFILIEEEKKQRMISIIMPNMHTPISSYSHSILFLCP